MDKIEGPLGIWTFPILNTIISVFSLRASASAYRGNNDISIASPLAQQQLQKSRTVVNKEEWEVKRNSEGRLEGFVVYRNVTENPMELENK